MEFDDIVRLVEVGGSAAALLVIVCGAFVLTIRAILKARSTGNGGATAAAIGEVNAGLLQLVRQDIHGLWARMDRTNENLEGVAEALRATAAGQIKLLETQAVQQEKLLAVQAAQHRELKSMMIDFMGVLAARETREGAS